MTDESPNATERPEGRPDPIEWGDIREPGSYLHLATGLIARVYAEDVARAAADGGGRGGGSVVLLAPNPGAPMAALREIAERHGFRMSA